MIFLYNVLQKKQLSNYSQKPWGWVPLAGPVEKRCGRRFFLGRLEHLAHADLPSGVDRLTGLFECW